MLVSFKRDIGGFCLKHNPSPVKKFTKEEMDGTVWTVLLKKLNKYKRNIVISGLTLPAKTPGAILSLLEELSLKSFLTSTS